MPQETPAFDPREFAKGIVPPKNPYAGYDARQAELAEEKDHPWTDQYAADERSAAVDPFVRRPDGRSISARKGMDREEAREQDYIEYAHNNHLTGPDTRTPEEVAAQAQINHVGRAAVEAALAKAKDNRAQ